MLRWWYTFNWKVFLFLTLFKKGMQHWKRVLNVECTHSLYSHAHWTTGTETWTRRMRAVNTLHSHPVHSTTLSTDECSALIRETRDRLARGRGTKFWGGGEGERPGFETRGTGWVGKYWDQKIKSKDARKCSCITRYSGVFSPQKIEVSSCNDTTSSVILEAIWSLAIAWTCLL